MTEQQKKFIIDSINERQISGPIGNAKILIDTLKFAEECKALIQAIPVDDPK